jgi:hypothetical protein
MDRTPLCPVLRQSHAKHDILGDFQTARPPRLMALRATHCTSATFLSVSSRAQDMQRERTLWREPPNHWRTITRLDAVVRVTHQRRRVSHCADNHHHLAEPTMTRDDVLVWLSFLGFVVLSGAAIWVLFPL